MLTYICTLHIYIPVLYVHIYTIHIYLCIPFYFFFIYVSMLNIIIRFVYTDTFLHMYGVRIQCGTISVDLIIFSIYIYMLFDISRRYIYVYIYICIYIQVTPSILRYCESCRDAYLMSCTAQVDPRGPTLRVSRRLHASFLCTVPGAEDRLLIYIHTYVHICIHIYTYTNTCLRILLLHVFSRRE